MYQLLAATKNTLHLSNHLQRTTNQICHPGHCRCLRVDFPVDPLCTIYM